MSTLLMEVHPDIVRVARVEDHQAVELHLFFKDSRAGARYHARVIKIENGTNGAFLDLGHGRAFLPYRHAKTTRAQSIASAVREGEMLYVELLADAVEEGKLPLAKKISLSSKASPAMETAALSPLVRACALVSKADHVLIDNPIAARTLKRACPAQVTIYSDKIRLFEAFGVEEKIAEALTGVVGLAGGANLVVESTKGATVIDVNGGSLTPLQANLLAAAAIPSVLRFQNLGGLIVVDFIDLKRSYDQKRVLKLLDSGLQHDPLSVDRTEFNRFGQVSLKRPRKGVSLRLLVEEKSG